MGFNLFDPTSWFDGGGSASSSSVTSTVNLNIQGLDKIGVTETIDVKPVSLTETVDLKPVSVELKPVTVTEHIDLKPVTLNENIDLKPVTLDETIDLKPVAVDTCQTLRLAPLPETHVTQPYHHHIGLTLYGVEYMGVTYHGESEQLIGSPHRPHVVERTSQVEHRHHDHPREFRGERGIKVRVLDDGD